MWWRQAALALLLWSAAGPAWAQALDHDSSLPIEITADQLDVDQNQQLATFKGNVDAVQGELVLSADLLKVHYGSGGAAAANSGSIRRIEAEGNVFLSSPQETAQGEVGVYDVETDSITIEGSVVLTRDDNVIRGQRLEIDLVSGQSRMAAAVTSSDGGSPPQRVRAIFTPKGGPAPAAGPAAAPSSKAE
jgi:lipopolysaccharide export system protein LptA